MTASIPHLCLFFHSSSIYLTGNIHVSDLRSNINFLLILHHAFISMAEGKAVLWGIVCTDCCSEQVSEAAVPYN